jgi:3-deoxy-D-manno-octulosonic-acid transferase
VTGPHLHNFSEISRRMREAGALLIGEDVQAVGDLLQHLLEDAQAREDMARAGARWSATAAARCSTLALVAPHLPPPPEIRQRRRR